MSTPGTKTPKKAKMSPTRKQYFVKFFLRIAIFLACLGLCFRPQTFHILKGMHFFDGFHIFHVLWLMWMYDMLMQLVPVKNAVALGSQKLFANRFRPVREKISPKVLKEHIVATTKAAYKVFALWILMLAGIGMLYFTGIINEIWLFMISVAFYVCDLICVLIWCPFRLIMGNKCCTTCRIFNWDHFMMFSPLMFLRGFFPLSLFVMSLVTFFVWELSVMIYPERFCEKTNAALKCSECTDKLCTQYCQKRRKS